MKQEGAIWSILVTLLAVQSSATASGEVVEFTDKDEWIAAVNEFATIGFANLPAGTFVTSQYADLGVLFTDGNDTIVCCSKVTFPEDGAGLDGNGNITLVFDTPQNWIAADFPGRLQIQLFADGKPFYLSGIFGVGGIGNFGGLISTEAFDAAVLMDFPQDFEAEIDDLHFGGDGVPGDVDGDGDVDINDFLALIAAWGLCPDLCPPSCPADFDGDCEVGISDFLMLLANWG